MEFNPYNSVQFLLMTKHDIWIGVSGVSMYFSNPILLRFSELSRIVLDISTLDTLSMSI